MLPEVGANQHWPYGLVDADGKSEFYARQLDGDFFADVKNSEPLPSSFGGRCPGEAGGCRCAPKQYPIKRPRSS